MSIDEKWKSIKDSLLDIEHIVRNLPSRSELEYHFLAWDAMIARYAKFKKGDRVEIVDPPKCTGGWEGSEHCLRRGALGTITERDFWTDSGFVYGFEADDSDLYKTCCHKMPDVLLRSHGRAVYCIAEFRLAKNDTPRVEKVWCDSKWGTRECKQEKGHLGLHTDGIDTWRKR